MKGNTADQNGTRESARQNTRESIQESAWQNTRKSMRKGVRILLLVGALVFAALVLQSMIQVQRQAVKETVSPVLDGWYYLLDGEKVEVTLPAQIELAQGNRGEQDALVLYLDIPENSAVGADSAAGASSAVGASAIAGNIFAGNTLTTKGARYHLKVYVDDCIIYEYRDSAFPRNGQMANKLNCDVVIPTDVGGKTLALVYDNVQNGEFRIPAVYVGTSSAVFWDHCMDDAPALMIVFAMAVLSVFALAVFIYMRMEKMTDRRILNIVAFLVLCGLWCITDSSLVQRLTGLSPITNVVSFYAFMLMSVPMLYFVWNTGTMRRHGVIGFIIDAFYLNALLQGIFYYVLQVQFIDMLFVTHLLLVCGIAVTIYTIWQEYRVTQDKELFITLRGFAMVASGGVLALFLYWTLEITYYEVIYECGILLFMFYLLGRVVNIVAENIRFRVETQVYERLSKEDSLTGLGNRRAFDDYMDELENRADTLDNAALIFLDIRKLKDVNDRSGHGAGDEMIISAARCIEHIFASRGRCFRVDGDEFCVIILDPAETEDVWSRELDEEIRRHNQECRNRLVVAKGLSYLKENGTMKTISDWKYEADQRVRENKGWRRTDRYEG